jgi:hypothetical protein
MSFFFHLEAHHLEAKTSTQLLTCEPTINILANQTFDLSQQSTNLHLGENTDHQSCLLL